MSLRKSLERTPAFFAADRRKAQKCTGPQTPQSQTRSLLDSLKAGRYARGLLPRMRAGPRSTGLAGLDHLQRRRLSKRRLGFTERNRNVPLNQHDGGFELEYDSLALRNETGICFCIRDLRALRQDMRIWCFFFKNKAVMSFRMNKSIQERTQATPTI